MLFCLQLAANDLPVFRLVSPESRHELSRFAEEQLLVPGQLQKAAVSHGHKQVVERHALDLLRAERRLHVPVVKSGHEAVADARYQAVPRVTDHLLGREEHGEGGELGAAHHARVAVVLRDAGDGVGESAL